MTRPLYGRKWDRKRRKWIIDRDRTVLDADTALLSLLVGKTVVSAEWTVRSTAYDEPGVRLTLSDGVIISVHSGIGLILEVGKVG